MFDALSLVSPTPRVREDVLADLEFIVPRPGEKARFLSAAMSDDGTPRYLFDVESRRVRIEDARRWASPARLRREGFELLWRPTDVTDLGDDELVATRYLPEVENVVREALGADEVVAFDATRRSDVETGAGNPDGARGPAKRIHVDYTRASGPKRAADVLGQERLEAALREGRPVVQVNLWRPLVGPVERSPLALADASSIRPADLVPTEQVFPHRVGEIYSLAAHPGQRFAYVPHMTPDEAILIKGWDSREDGRARFTPHSAFALAGQEKEAPRHSIEVRTFAILPR